MERTLWLLGSMALNLAEGTSPVSTKTLKRKRCPDCEHSVFKASMRAYEGRDRCVECYVKLRNRKKSRDSSQRDREAQRRDLRRKSMPVKYGSADHVKTKDDKAVISAEPLSNDELEKAASRKRRKPKKGAKVVVADKEHRLSDEDHIQGD